MELANFLLHIYLILLFTNLKCTWINVKSSANLFMTTNLLSETLLGVKDPSFPVG